MKKLFIVRKYVYAKDARDAIAKESSATIDDVWWDDDDRKSHIEKETNIGFKK